MSSPWYWCREELKLVVDHKLYIGLKEKCAENLGIASAMITLLLAVPSGQGEGRSSFTRKESAVECSFTGKEPAVEYEVEK